MADPPGKRDDTLRHDAERIPFYRNVKLLGWIAQIVFLTIAVGAILLLYRNVQSGLAASNLRFSFGFLDSRAGFALGEVPIAFGPSDSYLRALWVGIVNTLRVAVLGVVMCTLLGTLIGVMRLSSNWLLRQIAGWYVELIRNTPLPVQLILWYFAVILAVPPRILNSWRIGDVYVSQVGVAMPWLHTTATFGAWLPGLIAAGVAFLALYLWRRRVIAKRDRPGNAWAIPLIAAVAIAFVTYLPPMLTADPLPNVGASVESSRGRGTVFRDADSDGTRDASESPVARVPLVLSVDSGQLTDTTQDLTESRQVKESAFRFPQIRESEAESVTVQFVEPEAAEGLSIHFERFPSVGRVYRDLNGNGEFDPGETGVGEGAERRTFNGIGLVLEVEGFERRMVSERGGRIFFPPFAPLGGAEPAPGQPAGGQAGGGMGALFGAPADERVGVDFELEFLPVGPLVYSGPSIPRSSYYGGVSLSGAFLALLLGLVIYTASFVAEIVRGGIQAVPKGQTEAAKAVGLSGTQVFGLVVFPQAMRIILPPLISQFLNLTKNSSLAILVTFEDFFNVSNIIGNQTGQFIPVYLIILIGYLGISIMFSFILNIVNARLALVER